MEFEASLSDVDGLVGGSVVMHLVVTDPDQTIAQGGVLQSVPVTIYKLFMYDDGSDVRDVPSAAFGSRYLPNTTYVYNDADALNVEGEITPDTGGQKFPVSDPGMPDFKLFKADLSNPNDNLFHITLKPYDLAFSTDYRIDLEVTDSISNATYLSGAGNVNIWAGPGWVHPEQSEADFSGTEADTQQIVNFRLFDYECNAPTHVYGHACGIKEHHPMQA